MSNEERLDKEVEGRSEEKNEKGLVEPESSYGLMNRVIGVFIEPSVAFKHIAEKPEILGALLFTFFVFLLSSLLTMSKMVDLTVKSTLEVLSEKGMPEEAMDKVVMATEWATRFQSLSNLISVLVLWLIFALIVYIVGLIMGQEANYKHTLAVVAYSGLPPILIKNGIIGTIMMMTRDWASLSDFQLALMHGSLSLYTLFGNINMKAHLQAFLAIIDPFLIWSLILLAVGLKYANRTRMSGAWTTAIIAYIIYIAAMVPLTAMGISKLVEK